MPSDTAVLEAIIRSKADNSGFIDSKAAAIGLKAELAAGQDAAALFGSEIDRLGAKHLTTAARTNDHKVAQAGLNLVYGSGAGQLDGFLQKVEHSTVVLGESSQVSGGLAQKIGALANLGFTPASAAVVGLTAAVALSAEAMKSAMEISDQQEQVLRRLKQASDDTGTSYTANVAAVDDFIRANQRFIPNNQQAIDSFQMLLRSTGDQATALAGLNDIVDMAAVTGKDWNTVTNAINLGLQGQGRGLRELGIDVKSLSQDQEILTNATKAQEKAQKDVQVATEQHEQAARSLKEMLDGLADKNDKVRGSTNAYGLELAKYEKALHSGSATTQQLTDMQDRLAKMGGTLAQSHQLTRVETDRLQDAQNKEKEAADKLTKAQQDLASSDAAVSQAHSKQSAILDELHGKLKNGRQATSDLSQATNDLKGTWNGIATRDGPGLNSALASVVGGINDVIKADDALDQDQKRLAKSLADNLGSTLDDIKNKLEAISPGKGGRGSIGHSGVPYAPPPSDGRDHSGDGIPDPIVLHGGPTDVYNPTDSLDPGYTGTVSQADPGAVSALLGAGGMGRGGGNLHVHVHLEGAVVANDQAMDDLTREISERIVEHSSMHTTHVR